MMDRAAAMILVAALSPWARRISLVCLPLMVVAGPVRAAGDLGAPPTAAEQCLSPPASDRVKPDYPPDMLAIKRGALVRVRLTFGGPHTAPDVDFADDALGDFKDAVKQYARQLRVPCMAASQPPVTLLQEFDFVPNDGRKVALTLPVDANASRPGAKGACGVLLNGEGIRYPEQALRSRLEGNVVVRLRFSDPAKPPEMTVLDDGGSKQFVHAIESNIDALRMPCVGKAPIELQVFYIFAIDGPANRVLLRDVSLVQFLGSVKPIASGSVYFDTKLMKCPFDVRLTFRQPWNRNRIDELEEDVESRHAFLDWLSNLELDLKPRDANHVLGQSMLIHVPCAELNL